MNLSTVSGNEGKLPSGGSLYLYLFIRRVIKQTVVIIKAYYSLSTAYILPNSHL
jgi:hypothetical protein